MNHRFQPDNAGPRYRNPQDTRINVSLILGVVGLCVFPFLLGLLGLDFGSRERLFDFSAALDRPYDEALNSMFYSQSGSFKHTIMEWSAFCTTIFIAILSFIHYDIKRDIRTPVIGMALFCSGCMDAFHALAADRLIPAVADNRNLIPFT